MGNFVTRTRCPACHGEAFTQLYQCGLLESPVKEYLRDFYASQGSLDFQALAGGAFVLLECRHCRLVFQRDILTDEYLERLYEQWIDPETIFKQRLETQDHAYYALYAQELMQLLAYFGRLPAQLKVCDFGMGWGEWALMAKVFGCEVYGSEISSSRIAYAKAQGIRIVESADIPTHQFDYINTEQVFEHIPEPLDTLRYLARALTPQGMIKISVPNGTNIRKLLRTMNWKAAKEDRASLNPVSPLGHINCFSGDVIKRMAALAGMRPVYLPLGLQYRYLAYSGHPLQVAKNVAKPLYRTVLKQGTYVFLVKAGPSTNGVHL